MQPPFEPSGPVQSDVRIAASARRVPRREVLCTTTRHLASLALAATFDPAQRTLAQAAEPAAEDHGYVDAHVHVWTPDTTRYPLAGGYRREEMRPASFTPEQLWSHARPCGVTRVVLIQMSFYGFDNSYMLDCIREAQGAFAGVAVIDDDAANAAATMRDLLPRGVRGFRIYPRNRPVDRWLDGAGMQQMWRTGAESGQAMCCLVNPGALPAIDRMCGQFPDTPVVIDHFGRVGIDGQIREAELAQLCALARHAKTYVKVSAFYALGRKQPPYTDLVPMIRRLVDAFGPQRLMWATDCPYQVDSHTYLQSIELVRDRLDFLSAADRRALLHDTAAKLFFAGT
ncbi:MAG: amidohydrolase family protein [Pirellulales bacterium]|nr:amidohydrolase family protein [Pirellulales bacterium]